VLWTPRFDPSIQKATLQDAWLHDIFENDDTLKTVKKKFVFRDYSYAEVTTQIKDAITREKRDLECQNHPIWRWFNQDYSYDQLLHRWVRAQNKDYEMDIHKYKLKIFGFCFIQTTAIHKP